MRDAYRRNRLTGFLVYFCCSRHSVNMPLRLPPRPSRLFFVFVFFFFGAREEAVFGQRLRSKGELRGLYSLRSSLGIRAKNWPRKTDPCEKWDGITCQNGSVTALDLSALRRTRLGKLSPFFSVDGLRNLTTLSVFNSTGFTLSGSIPDWFGSQLSNSVSILDLRLSSITGSIPSSLGDMTGLVELVLSGNLLTGEIPFRFAQLRNLTKLDLSNNMLEGSLPPVLGDLSSLKLLNVGHNSLSGSVPSELSDLKRLQLLDFGNNSFIGSLPETMFQSFIQLNSLSLNNNKFSGVLPDSLWTLSNLRLLDVSDNNFTGSLLEIAARFNVTNGDLNFSNNLFYGSLPSWIGLRSLDVSSNYFQGDLPLFQNGNQNVSVETNCFTNATSQRSVDDCSSFYTSKGLKYGSIDPLTPNQNTRQNSRNKLLYILVGVFGGLFLILLAILLVCFCKKKRKAVTNQHPTRSRDLISSGRRAPNSRFMPNSGFSLNLSAVGDSFTYDQLLQATSNFSDENLIKHGHSGDLYHGNLSSGARVVVKRVDVRTLKKEPYLVELDFFARASHTRLVPLLGHCLENDNEKLIVYKDMPNGDLSTALFRKPGNEEEGLQSLDWITRLKIAIGVAEALCYMHHECTPPLVHRDIQASSVILDDRFEVRLGSMSEVCVQEGGGHQNAITKFLRFSQSSDQTTPGSPPATCTYDVYCMGKVLLELVTGHLGISASNDAATNAWLDKTLANISIYEKDLLTNILDPSLILDEDLMEEVWAMAIVAKSCLNPRPSKRPQVKDLERLQLPLMVNQKENDEKLSTAFTVTVDVKNGTTTGVSAKDRAATILALASPSSTPKDFNRPGHIFPLKYREGGVLKRAGHTEASVDLSMLAGLPHCSVLCEIVDDRDGSMARLPKLQEFAKNENLKIISISDLIRFRRKREKLVERTSVARLPLKWGSVNAYCYKSIIDGIEHIAMVKGDIGDGQDILVRVHSECLTGDIFGSEKCDCGNQLELAMKLMEKEGRGVLVYLRGHEGRGIGLGHKLRAYNLQDAGLDTVEANEELGLPVDSREYGIGAQILRDLGVRTMKLLTNNPSKYTGLKGHGLSVVGRVPLLTPITAENKRYMDTKRTKMGHIYESSES